MSRLQRSIGILTWPAHMSFDTGSMAQAFPFRALGLG